MRDMDLARVSGLDDLDEDKAAGTSLPGSSEERSLG
jgi:hypothetical protein